MSTAQRKPYAQVSLRLSPETLSTIREIALVKNISQSEVMRAATALLRKQFLSCNDNIKLATVDVNDNRDATHYAVKEWIVCE